MIQLFKNVVFFFLLVFILNITFLDSIGFLNNYNQNICSASEEQDTSTSCKIKCCFFDENFLLKKNITIQDLNLNLFTKFLPDYSNPYIYSLIRNNSPPSY